MSDILVVSLSVAAALAILYLTCRYVPGFKCITYCEINLHRKKKAAKYVVQELMNRDGSFDLSGLTAKKAKWLYKSLSWRNCKISGTSHCQYIKYKQLLPQLKDLIAEYQLLGVE